MADIDEIELNAVSGKKCVPASITRLSFLFFLQQLMRAVSKPKVTLDNRLCVTAKHFDDRNGSEECLMRIEYLFGSLAYIWSFTKQLLNQVLSVLQKQTREEIKTNRWQAALKRQGRDLK